jgi:hypothetical protein
MAAADRSSATTWPSVSGEVYRRKRPAPAGGTESSNPASSSGESDANLTSSPCRDLADLCLVLVHRQLQLAHDFAQAMQRRFGVAPPAQDHEVIGLHIVLFGLLLSFIYLKSKAGFMPVRPPGH